MLLQNSTFKGGNIDYTYKKSFNIFAKGLNYLENLCKDDVIRTFANILIQNLRYPTKETVYWLEILKSSKL